MRSEIETKVWTSNMDGKRTRKILFKEMEGIELYKLVYYCNYVHAYVHIYKIKMATKQTRTGFGRGD